MASQFPNTTLPYQFYYAEYLPNISTVTYTIHPVPQTTYSINPTAALLHVTSSSPNTESVDIPLPFPAHWTVWDRANISITQYPRDPCTSVIRLPAQPLSSRASARPDIDIEDEDSLVPWRARELHGADVEVKCAACAVVLVKRGAVRTWKDLPREGWAELMDLWHCHKPDEGGHDDAQVGSGKGYAAGSRLVARKGTGFVDVIGFLVSGEDCVGVEVAKDKPTLSSHLSNGGQQPLLCGPCRTVIGAVDDESDGLRLWKPYLSLSIQKGLPQGAAISDTSLSQAVTTPIPTQSSPTAPPYIPQSPRPHAFPMEKWLAAHLLSLVSSTGVRKFRLRRSQRVTTHADDVNDTSAAIKRVDREIWVFSTSVTYTSSARRHCGAIEALKVFYRCTDAPEAGGGDGAGDEMDNGSESLRKGDLMIEDVRLPERLEDELWTCLEESTGILPEKNRKFGEWDVGLIARFSREDLDIV